MSYRIVFPVRRSSWGRQCRQGGRDEHISLFAQPQATKQPFFEQGNSGG